jgi:hypothetical protein
MLHVACIFASLDHYSTLEMELVRLSEKLIYFYHTAWSNYLSNFIAEGFVFEDKGKR